MDWRKIEKALVDACEREGYGAYRPAEQSSAGGDWVLDVIGCGDLNCAQVDTRFNLTAIAKRMAEVL